jgi:single-stranded-DNA-specific exonuclease
MIMKTFFDIQPSDSIAYNALLEQCKVASQELAKHENILIVSHLDADGLSSCAIARIALERKKISADWMVVQGIDDEILDYMSKYSLIILTDIGSSQLSSVMRIKGSKIIILDHHEPDDNNEYSHIIHINPHMVGVSNPKSISGAGVAYIFSMAIDENNRDLAHIAIIGAIGDVQEEKGFSGINSIIFEDAIQAGKISAMKGLKLFGAQSKSLVRLIAYNNDLCLKGITGSIPRAKEFIEDLGISIYDDKGERRYIDLDDEEKKMLNAAIIDYRQSFPGAPDIEGFNYILNDEKQGSIFCDAREYATLLNACGRMERSDIGIGALMSIAGAKRDAARVLKEYKSEIGLSINWFKEQYHDNKKITRGKGYIIIDGRGIMRASIAGTLASIVSRMEEIKDGTLILSLASLDNGDIKASLRKKGNGDSDLHDIIMRISHESGCLSGGHENASGATIPKENYESFLSCAIRIMEE